MTLQEKLGVLYARIDCSSRRSQSSHQRTRRTVKEGGSEMTCKDCPYFWKEEDESYPSCKWTIRCPGDIPPCEED